MKKRTGFTLIELMIVVAIIAILATVVIVNVTSAGAKSRDAKRKSDVVTIKKAIDSFQVDNDRYPICANPDDKECRFNDGLTPGMAVYGSTSNLLASDIIILQKYLSVFPTDPNMIKSDWPALYGYADTYAGDHGEGTGVEYGILAAMEINEGNLMEEHTITDDHDKKYYFCRTSTDLHSAMWADDMPNCNF